MGSSASGLVVQSSEESQCLVLEVIGDYFILGCNGGHRPYWWVSD
jgi:hypothetical protein